MVHLPRLDIQQPKFREIITAFKPLADRGGG